MKTFIGDRKVRIAVLVIVAAFITTLAIISVELAQADADKGRERQLHVDQLVEEWGNSIRSDAKLLSSSNPYKYTENKEFNNIAQLNIEYFPAILEWIRKDESLTSYVLTIATQSGLTP